MNISSFSGVNVYMMNGNAFEERFYEADSTSCYNVVRVVFAKKYQNSKGLKDLIHSHVLNLEGIDFFQRNYMPITAVKKAPSDS